MENQPSVLIVDDEIGPRESLRMILKTNYEVIAVDNGKKALELIHQKHFDLVTLDLKMPGIPGIEVLKSIRDFDPDVEVIIITGYGTLKTATESIRYGVFDYISKPFDVPEIISVIKRSTDRKKLSDKLKSLLNEIDKLKINGNSNYITKDFKAGDTLIEKAKEIFYAPTGHSNKNMDSMEFIKVLACALESKDSYTHGHSGRVTYFSTLLAEKLFILPQEKEEIQIASYLHDIGKIGIGNNLVDKKGKLSKEEWDIIKEHPEKGVYLIESLQISRSIISIVRHHHERFDGKGYPYGLVGKDIPLGSRIISIADAFDAMNSNRPYRQALNKEEVLDEFRQCAGTQFDPELVDIFLNVLEEKKDFCFGAFSNTKRN